MKPLSELVKEWKKGPHVYYSGRMTAVNELQAWLREADSEEMPDWFENTLKYLFPNAEYQPTKVNAHWLKVGLNRLWRKVRHNLLGTTRTEGEK